jgi:hypothetical protein
MLKMDQNTKIIIGVVVIGAALWYFNKEDPKVERK